MVLRRRFWFWGVLLGVGLALMVGLWLLREAPPSTDISEGVSLQEGVEVSRQEPALSLSKGAEQATPPPGGEHSTITDSVEFIIRDASGRVKRVGDTKNSD